ncbi:MAG: shikimate dehydrogenase family protein [Eggerthellaceae bacterium]
MNKGEITGNTMVMGLIGSPVNKSKAPLVNNLSFDLLDLDAKYLAFDVPSENLQAAVEGAKALGFKGFNVTVPHKNAVLQYLDEVSEAAQLMNSVNTVIVTDGKTRGENTDAKSFTIACATYGFPVKGKRVTMVDIAAEGPAYATQSALEGASEIVIVTKDEDVQEKEALYAAVAQKTSCIFRVIGLQELEDDAENFSGIESAEGGADGSSEDIAKPQGNAAHLSPAQLVAQSQIICNASRIGTGADEGLSPIPANLLSKDMLVLDAIYEPSVTALLANAHVVGARIVGGLELLLNQAALAQKLWLQVDMPVLEIAKRMTF